MNFSCTHCNREPVVSPIAGIRECQKCHDRNRRVLQHCLDTVMEENCPSCNLVRSRRNFRPNYVGCKPCRERVIARYKSLVGTKCCKICHDAKVLSDFPVGAAKCKTCVQKIKSAKPPAPRTCKKCGVVGHPENFKNVTTCKVCGDKTRQELADEFYSRPYRACTTCNETKSRREFRYRTKQCKSCTEISVKKRLEHLWSLPERECCRCKVVKPHAMFAKSQRRCKSCDAAARQKQKYNLRRGQKQEMVSNQGGKCPICLRSDPKSKHGLHIDHSHVTGKVRGALCSGCNTLLGHLGDELETAAEIVPRILPYLQRAKDCTHTYEGYCKTCISTPL